MWLLRRLSHICTDLWVHPPASRPMPRPTAGTEAFGRGKGVSNPTAGTEAFGRGRGVTSSTNACMLPARRCKLLLGDGTMEHTLYARPYLACYNGRLIMTRCQLLHKLPGMISWSTCGLEHKRNQFVPRIPVAFASLSTSRHVSWFCRRSSHERGIS